jgi:hypothetical protein
MPSHGLQRQAKSGVRSVSKSQAQGRQNTSLVQMTFPEFLSFSVIKSARLVHNVSELVGNARGIVM